ncbi:STAS domain-containing protein [Pontibacter diazotrophicus]|nr:hypothetical protein [Pontibacter diazotrophicus]
MKITHKKYDGHSLIIVQGIVDKSTDSAINEIILNTPAQEKSLLWIDCSDIKQIIRVNKSLSDFINYLLHLKNEGVQVLLYGLDNNTKRMLKLLKLDKSFGQAATLDDAYLTLSHTLTDASPRQNSVQQVEAFHIPAKATADGNKAVS